MHPSVLVLIAWIGQLLLLYGRRIGKRRMAAVLGATLDIGPVIWLCTQHRWLLAAFTLVVLPLLTAVVLGILDRQEKPHPNS